ncbi:hypothetical protein Corgl_0438 [Coriobacterium glomerans PW2]|uniref:HEAT repeat domain-containing protein n=1 Tax=Coriobacterium glomerans (strain ATCC 49209 / DSM 20642 / JCM 10262 / PW2) TaxID=700015 RepID=F2N781_CORGP|nr:hypothetical protein [Coriobacterium glomerans]AEB06556.1 hypothetical protein Corgl_0438 [Coriobacterium glomerans PW2]
MTETNDVELSAEERERLELVETDSSALSALIEDLSSASRRSRQFSARVVALLSARDPGMVAPFAAELIDALYRPEAQTRWEILDALTSLVPVCAKEVGSAFDGAEAALFDELSPALRLSAFRLLTTWGATDRGRSKKVWPMLDEAIQCYHGDLEYRDMLGCLYVFASGKITGSVAEELAGRIQFDAENGKGSYLKARSREIYDMLSKRFKFNAPKKRARVKPASDDDEADVVR